MALNFPSSPTVGPPATTYGRWQWNGIAWVPIVTAGEPMLPIAGGTITGNLGVAGTTTLTGTVTAAGHAQLNTLDVNGQANFIDGVSIDGMNAATEDWVNDIIDDIKNLGFFAGSFPDFASVPLNVGALPGVTPNDFITVQEDETHNGAVTRYIATAVAADGTITWTYDFTYSTDITGKMDLVPSAADGHLAMFDDSGDGQVEDAGIAPSDLMRRGTPGTYTQGTDFTDFQTFLDENVNNRFFESTLIINLTADVTTNIYIHNVTISAPDGTWQQSYNIGRIEIRSAFQIADYFEVSYVSGLIYVFPSGPLTCNSLYIMNCLQFDCQSGVNVTGNCTVLGASRFMIAGTATFGGTFNVSQVSNLWVRGGAVFTCNVLTSNGQVSILPGATFNAATITSNPAGFIVDGRDGNPLDTFQRNPADVFYSTPGSYTWTCQRTGRYQLIAGGPGGGGAAWAGDGGSTARYSSGGSGAVARGILRITAGQTLAINVGRGGGAAGSQAPATRAALFGTNGQATTIYWNYVNAHDGAAPIAGWETRHWAMYACAGVDGGSPNAQGYGDAPNIVGVNGTAGSATGSLTPGLQSVGASWHGPVQLTSGPGGRFFSDGGDGSALIAYVGP